MGFGGGSQTSTSTYEMSPEQRKILELAMPWLTQFAEKGIQLPQQSVYGGFNPLQERSQQMALDSVKGLQGVGQTNLDAFNRLTSGDFMDVNKNPYFKGNLEAVRRPL